MRIYQTLRRLLPAAAIACMAVSMMAADGSKTGGSKADAQPHRLTAAEALAAAPRELFPTVDSITRLDMVDYFRAGSVTPSKNLVGGECRVILEDSDRIVFATSKVSEYTLALLPGTGRQPDPVIMVVRTVRTPAPDSSVRFFDTGWNELKGIFEVPVLDDWMLPEAKKQTPEVQNAVPFVIADATYTPETRTLTFATHPATFLPKESLPTAEKSLRESISYRWNGRRFVPAR